MSKASRLLKLAESLNEGRNVNDIKKDAREYDESV